MGRVPHAAHAPCALAPAEWSVTVAA